MQRDKEKTQFFLSEFAELKSLRICRTEESQNLQNKKIQCQKSLLHITNETSYKIMKNMGGLAAVIQGKRVLKITPMFGLHSPYMISSSCNYY